MTTTNTCSENTNVAKIEFVDKVSDVDFDRLRTALNLRKDGDVADPIFAVAFNSGTRTIQIVTSEGRWDENPFGLQKQDVRGIESICLLITADQHGSLSTGGKGKCQQMPAGF